MRKNLLALLPILALAGCSGADPIEPTQDFDKGDPNAGSAISAPAFEAVEYPAGPYGTQVDSIMGNFEFLGWKAPAAVGYDPGAFEKVSMADFYDPAGEKGIKVIMLNASAVWCTVCRAEYKKFDQDKTYNKYKAQGVEFISAIFEDSSNPPKPAAPKDLQWWGDTYNVEFPMVLDPGFKLGRFFTADATPMNLLIDAKTMKIVGKYLGGDTTAMFKQLDSLL